MKRKRQTILALLLCAIMVLSACQGTKDPQPAAKTPVVNTATASANGFGGTVTVTVTVTDGILTNVSVEGPYETQGVGDVAIEKISADMMEARTVEVDAWSGATVSSKAILAAAKAAYNEAMGISMGSAEVKMKPGTYEAEGSGYSWIGNLKMSVTVDETTITDISVVDKNRESTTIFNSVIEYLIPRILENQSLAVDAITGATASSNGVKQAVRGALEQALAAGGSDASAIDNFYAPVEKSTAVKTMKTSVLVVGMGGAGCAAAMSAAEAQKAAGLPVDVLAIDKAGKYGGTSAFCGSPMGVNPQKMMDEFNDGEEYVDAEAFRQDWYNYVGGGGKTELIDLMIDNSGDTVDWLMYDHGFVFNQPRDEAIGGSFFKVCLDYTFSGKKEDGRDYGEREFGNRADTVQSYFDGLIEDYVALGGKYMLETEGVELMYDSSSNTVTGVKAKGADGTSYEITADAVILATGGFAGNDKMEEKYLKYPVEGVSWRLYGMMQNDGKMIQSAIDIGAGTFNIGMTPVSHYNTSAAIMRKYPVNIIEGKVDSRWGYPSTWSLNDVTTTMAINPDCLWVNPEGERFADESAFHVSWAGGPTYWSIWGANQIKEIQNSGFTYVTTTRGYGQGGVQKQTPIPEVYEVLQTGMDMGIVFKADTIKELADIIGISADNLKQTVETYDTACKSGIDSEFGKKADYLKEIEGPYYAVKAINLEYGTPGGLDVDVDLSVLLADGTTKINGLYATGYDSSGVLYTEEKAYVNYGGAALGWAFTSGRLAGQNAVAYIESKSK
jgi:uncharacterized protein with FMN-binding domain/succinate dehydrogenase/fumarate reductase flavoprotein subunit